MIFFYLFSGETFTTFKEYNTEVRGKIIDFSGRIKTKIIKGI